MALIPALLDLAAGQILANTYPAGARMLNFFEKIKQRCPFWSQPDMLIYMEKTMSKAAENKTRNPNRGMVKETISRGGTRK